MTKRILSLLVALVMVLGLLPVSAFATEPDTYAVRFQGHSAQLDSFKVYTYTDGVKGEHDLLEGVEDTDTSNTQLYTTELAAGDYWVDAYDAAGDHSGGIKVTVENKELNEFVIYRAYMLKASNSGWVLGTDYTVTALVQNQDKTVTREVSMGTAKDYSGNDLPAVLCLHGDTVKITYTPSEARQAENYIETFKSATMTANNSSWSVSIPQAVAVSFQVPNGAVVDAGRFHDYYVYDFAEPKSSTKPEEGDWTYTYMIPKSTDWFYRVQHESGVTYWNYARWTADTTVTVTADDLYIGSGDFDKETIYRYDYSVNDRADIYLNINGRGHMNMEVGGHYQLNVFRNWMAIESINNAKVALPDMTYTVIDMEGNPSDLLTIVPDEHNSSVALMTANGEGTAVVLVTYDAMTHMLGMGGTRHSAIWPECTGVFVVTVGEEAQIETNMMIERYEAADTALDAEHDILFYLGGAGASYSFTPEAGCTVTVNRAVIADNALTYEGFTAEGVTTDENGTVTVSGLTTGRHIIKIEKDGKAVYQVITARGVSYELQDAEGNVLTEETGLKAGDTVYLQFRDLVNPAEKLSGAYNFNASIYYVGEDGNSFRSNPGSTFGVYDFSGNPVRQKIAITIPKYWSELSYTMAGAIKMGGFGNVSVGGHRGVTYASGLNPNFSASTVGMILSRMPEVTFTLAETSFLTGKLTFADDSGNPIDRTDLTVTMADSAGNAVQVAADGTFKCLAETYNYVVSGAGVEYTTGTVTVTEEGVNEFTVTLNATSDAAWDGSSMTEPARDENGVYLIATGAELRWFANAVSSDSAIGGRLTADIDLAHYPWTPIAAFSGTFDGDGYRISNLNVTAAAQYQALFARVNSGGVVKNLTVSGSVTSTANYTAGVVGYLNYGTVENVVSDVTVSGSNYTGGIAGYSYAGTIRSSANRGTVNGNGYTAGIVGSVAGTSTVTGCYNTASVTGVTTYVGGILGDASGTAVTVTACYNLGAVSGSNYVGGVIARATGASAVISDCYNAGTVTATGTTVGGFLGNWSNASLTRCYWLEGTAASDPAAAMLTADQLRDAELASEHYGKVCNGYPALLWQEDVTFHTVPGSGNVTESNCTVGGYTVYVCEECGEGFTADYVDALGHDWCDDLGGCDDCVYTAPTCTGEGSVVRNCRFPGCEELRTDVVPATGHTEDESQTVVGVYYKNCICAVCGESYTVYNDARMAHMSLDGTVISDVTMSDSGNYPWVWDAGHNRFESSNVGVNSSASTTSITLTLSHSANVSFNYGASSEGNYDKLTITAIIGGQNVTVANAISGTSTGSFAQELEAGTYTLTFSFTKDSSTARNDDLGWVSDLTVAATHTVSFVENPAEEYLAVPATCVDAPVYYVSCEACGEKGTGTFVYGEPMADAHSYTESVIEASCGVEGYTEHTCTLCGHNYRDNFVPALEHEYESVVTAPTYEAGGYTTHTCVHCGDSYTDDLTDPLVLETVAVYLSISYDDRFSVGGETDEVVALRDIEIPYFDLALYGLEEFYFVSEEYGSGSGEIGDNTYYGQEPYENKVTMLHLYIYATEVFYFGLEETEAGKGWLYEEGHLGTGVLDIGGSSGSLFLNDFWNGSMNLNYYRNYEYPLASSGWGATADQILLHDGDVVTLGAFTSWSFFGDSTSIFNYIAADGELVTTEAVQGESLSLQVMHAGANMGMGDGTAQTPVYSQPDVYVVAVAELSSGDVTEWTYVGTADENGQLTMSTADLAPGEYIVAVAGQYGAEFTDEICSTPGGIRLSVVPCTEHQYVDVVVEPGCTSDGYTEHTCALCGYCFRDSFAAAPGHAYTETVVGATCETMGYTEHTCAVCGHSYVSDLVDALGHSCESTVTEPTHEKMGYTTHTCLTCGHEYVDSYVDALEHTYIQTVTTEPTCTSEGVMTFTCDCGESYTEVIPVAAHSYTAEVTAPTCTAMGYTAYTCDCGHSYAADFVDALDHDCETIVVEATCTGYGYTMEQCRNCDHSVITAITQPTGHTETVVGAVEPGCGVEGYTGDAVCADCGVILAVGEAISAVCPSGHYTDVPVGVWYHEAVDYVTEKGIMNGMGDHTFAPAAATNRAMMAVLLYRMAGEPSVEEVENPFTDVEAGSWYHDAVVWAVSKGIVNGKSATVFAPADDVTREQMVTMLYRYAGSPETGLEALNGYTDADAVSGYAREAFAWAIGSGIVSGMTETTLAPAVNTNRAQIAVILMRYLEK